MSLTATTVNTWQDGTSAYWAASVAIASHNVEFIVNTALNDESGNPLDTATISANLQSAMTAAITAQTSAPQPLTGVMAGTVSL